MHKDSTIYRAIDVSLDGTEIGEPKDFSMRRETFPLAKREALASIEELSRYVAYSHNEGKVLAAVLIIESIEI